MGFVWWVLFGGFCLVGFRRPDHYSSLAACALSLTLSRGRGNSVAVVFAVARFYRCVFLPLRVFAIVCFDRCVR
ncbi:hypothetical protein LVJ83_11180 [Uruburuella testudinis]|uniref:Secreted protein n=1 Tax=Uruburuella testudinis TaxID=1282863 RepID=A0ABY4DTZ8_9NEIS|nr:hypothetical protein [Uruburuella testudinis]UOO81489.1 hypothetical protein LVJ83_11180 [Uruburuella testudinis]